MTWSISMALLTTKVVRSLTYTPLSTFSFNSSLSLGSWILSCDLRKNVRLEWGASCFPKHERNHIFCGATWTF